MLYKLGRTSFGPENFRFRIFPKIYCKNKNLPNITAEICVRKYARQLDNICGKFYFRKKFSGIRAAARQHLLFFLNLKFSKTIFTTTERGEEQMRAVA
jgi:hypothetical protein